MSQESPPPSARRSELLELAYRYVCEHGMAELSLRPLAAAIGSSPRVLLYLFDSKAGLIRALLARARADELALLDRMRHAATQREADLPTVAVAVWEWLADPDHRGLLTLWVEGYARSLTDPDGPWRGFASATVQDWLTLLTATQPTEQRDSTAGRARATAVLAILRGGLLDLLATGDTDRTTTAVADYLRQLNEHPTDVARPVTR